MAWQGFVMFGLVSLWLAPGSLWRPVALALLVQWVGAEFLYQLTGSFVPVRMYIPTDIAVIVAVIVFRSHWSDWLIIAPYPVVWRLYAQPVSHGQWTALFWIAAGQFLIAGPWPQIQRSLGAFSHGRLRPTTEA